MPTYCHILPMFFLSGVECTLFVATGPLTDAFDQRANMIRNNNGQGDRRFRFFATPAESDAVVSVVVGSFGSVGLCVCCPLEFGDLACGSGSLEQSEIRSPSQTIESRLSWL